MSLTKPNSDKNRKLLPPPPGRGAVPKDEGLSTFLKLTKVTGFGTPNKDMPLGQEVKPKNVMPGMARMFAALPGVERSDIVQPYRGMIVRK